MGQILQIATILAVSVFLASQAEGSGSQFDAEKCELHGDKIKRLHIATPNTGKGVYRVFGIWPHHRSGRPTVVVTDLRGDGKPDRWEVPYTQIQEFRLSQNGLLSVVLRSGSTRDVAILDRRCRDLLTAFIGNVIPVREK